MRLPNESDLEDLRTQLEGVVCEKKADDEYEIGRKKIQTNNRSLDEITDETLRSMIVDNKKKPHIFVRARQLSRVGYNENGIPLIERMDEHKIRHCIARCANFVRCSYNEKKSEWVETYIPPPMDIVHDIASLNEQPFPILQGISETPIIREDGSIIETPGYDKETKLYFAPSNGCMFEPVPPDPSTAEVIEAVDLLQEVLCDFPFVKEPPDAPNASRTNALAAMMSPILRPIIPGCIPMAIIDKPQAGTGASLLCDTISLIATGQEMATITEAKSEEEWQKIITSMLREGRVLVTIDNVEGKLYAPSLASLLTATTWQGRILGRSEMVTFPNSSVWIANGNNIKLGGDLQRRCYWSRMDAESAEPWLLNKEYKHPHLRKWARDNRGRIVSAILTITKAWILAGRPMPENPKTLGGFEGWTDTMNGIFFYCGIPDFLGNLEMMYRDLDQDTSQWQAFFVGWFSIFGTSEKTVADIYHHLKLENDSKEQLSTGDNRLFDVIPDWLAGEFERKATFTRRLGAALSKHDGMRYRNGLVIRRSGTKQHAVRWQVDVWDKSVWEQYLSERV